MRKTLVPFPWLGSLLIFSCMAILTLVTGCGGSSGSSDPQCELKVDGISDVNCDGKLVIAGMGDSVIFGTLADGSRDRKDGYIGRLSAHFPTATIRNLGIPGIDTRDLLTALKNRNCRLSSRGKLDCVAGNSNGTVLIDSLQDVDYLFIDIGRNDYFLESEESWTPVHTVKSLEAIYNYLGNFYHSSGLPEPVITFAYLLPVRRAYQQPFVADVNKALGGSNLPVHLRNNTVSTTLIGNGNVHPTAAGYAELTMRAVAYLQPQGR